MSKDEGTDVNELYLTGNVKFEIEYNGKVWKFERMKNIPFGIKQRILSNLLSFNTKTGMATMDAEKYYMEIIPAMLLKAPPGFDVTKINEEFGNLLIAHFPNPGEFNQVESPSKEDIKN